MGLSNLFIQADSKKQMCQFSILTIYIIFFFPCQFQNGFNGGNVNEAYPSQLDVISNSQTAAHLQPVHHPTEPRSFPDLASSGFM